MLPARILVQLFVGHYTSMRLEWATAEAERGPATPALTKFIEESREECRKLNLKLARLEIHLASELDI